MSWPADGIRPSLRSSTVSTDRRSSRSAATGVVAQPQNGSRTMSSGLLDARMMRS